MALIKKSFKVIKQFSQKYKSRTVCQHKVFKIMDNTYVKKI